MRLSYTTIAKVVESQQWDSANEYGEPGYSVKDGGFIILGNYNGSWCETHKRIMNQLEAQDVELEWSDEWVVDHENNAKAYRTSSDSYMWTPSTQYTNDGELLTPDDELDDWLVWAVNNANRCMFDTYVGGGLVGKLEAQGFQRHPDNGDEYENGWHHGQTDDPKVVMAEFTSTHDDVECVFVMTETSQFYCKFVMYWRDAKPTIWISGNHNGHDQQVRDAVAYMERESPVTYARFLEAYSEWPTLTWDAVLSGLDTDENGVDSEYTSWVCDWVESNTSIVWWEGEPVIMGSNMLRELRAEDDGE